MRDRAIDKLLKEACGLRYRHEQCTQQCLCTVLLFTSTCPNTINSAVQLMERAKHQHSGEFFQYLVLTARFLAAKCRQVLCVSWVTFFVDAFASSRMSTMPTSPSGASGGLGAMQERATEACLARIGCGGLMISQTSSLCTAAMYGYRLLQNHACGAVQGHVYIWSCIHLTDETYTYIAGFKGRHVRAQERALPRHRSYAGCLLDVILKRPTLL